MIYIVGLIILFLAIWGAYIIYAAQTKNKDVMSFKDAMDLTDLPIVTFYIGEHKLHFLLDTGSMESHIDAHIVEKYSLNVDYIKGKEMVTYGSSGKGNPDKIGNINMFYNNKEYVEPFIIDSNIHVSFEEFKKMKGINLHGLLGSKFFNKYKYILDFNKMIFYR